MSAIHQLGLDLKANLRIRYTLLIASCKSASCQVNCKPPSLQLSLAKAEWSGNKKPRKRRFRALTNKVTAYTQVCAKIFCSCVQFQVVQSRLLALKYSLTPISTIHPTPSLTPPLKRVTGTTAVLAKYVEQDIDWGDVTPVPRHATLRPWSRRAPRRLRRRSCPRCSSRRCLRCRRRHRPRSPLLRISRRTLTRVSTY